MPGPIDLDRTKPAREQAASDRKKLTLFRLNEQDYKVDARPPVTLALRYLDDLRKHGEDLAVAKMLPALLGETGWSALLAEEDLTGEEFEAVVKAASSLVMGSLEGQALDPLDD